ncbi:infB, partial [Ophiophagus hannah]
MASGNERPLWRAIGGGELYARGHRLRRDPGQAPGSAQLWPELPGWCGSGAAGRSGSRLRGSRGSRPRRGEGGSGLVLGESCQSRSSRCWHGLSDRGGRAENSRSPGREGARWVKEGRREGRRKERKDMEGKEGWEEGRMDGRKS